MAGVREIIFFLVAITAISFLFTLFSFDTLPVSKTGFANMGFCDCDDGNPCTKDTFIQGYEYPFCSCKNEIIAPKDCKSKCSTSQSGSSTFPALQFQKWDPETCTCVDDDEPIPCVDTDACTRNGCRENEQGAQCSYDQKTPCKKRSWPFNDVCCQDYESCCGESCYDPEFQTCCGGDTVCAKGESCCNGKCYDPKIEKCCASDDEESHVCGDDRSCCGTSDCCKAGQKCCYTLFPSSVLDGPFEFFQDNCVSPGTVTMTIAGTILGIATGAGGVIGCISTADQLHCLFTAEELESLEDQCKENGAEWCANQIREGTSGLCDECEGDDCPGDPVFNQLQLLKATLE